jgi:hypothetical protein
MTEAPSKSVPTELSDSSITTMAKRRTNRNCHCRSCNCCHWYDYFCDRNSQRHLRPDGLACPWQLRNPGLRAAGEANRIAYISGQGCRSGKRRTLGELWRPAQGAGPERRAMLSRGRHSRKPEILAVVRGQDRRRAWAQVLPTTRSRRQNRQARLIARDSCSPADIATVRRQLFGAFRAPTCFTLQVNGH